MRLHRLLRLNDNKFAASCETGLMQVDCKDFLFVQKLDVSSFANFHATYIKPVAFLAV